MRTDFEALKGLYDRYVAGYRDAGGRLPVMMELKYRHTAQVVENARLIADGEGFPARERELALAAALLHDTGRYEQLRRYDTFRDSESVDHAVFSHDIVRANGWLEATVADREDREAIAAAVLCHNRRELPADLGAPGRLVADAVRDADKLDIFRVLEQQVSECDWRHDARAFWNLKVDVAPSPAVVAATAAGEPVDYGEIRSLADFVLIQVGWMLSGLAFATSRRICRERGHLEFRRRFLAEIGGGEESDRVCALALGRLIAV